jgi:hypothetical protein
MIVHVPCCYYSLEGRNLPCFVLMLLYVAAGLLLMLLPTSPVLLS